MAYIYILHFDEPLHHSRHYAGCTEKLLGRLTAHANGAGSRLCQVLREQGIGWKLGSLALCSHRAMRRIERHLKNQANAPRFCAICTEPAEPTRINDTTPYPVGLIPFATDSQSLQLPPTPAEVTLRFTSDREPPTTIKFIRNLMAVDKDALGFIPAGGPEGLQLGLGLTVIVSRNGQDVGYAIFTVSSDHSTITIHQAAVQDDARLLGHGKAMVDHLAKSFPYQRLACKVREDLAANDFWLALGFESIRSAMHKTSARTIHQYVRSPLFAEPSKPSNGDQA